MVSSLPATRAPVPSPRRNAGTLARIRRRRRLNISYLDHRAHRVNFPDSAFRNPQSEGPFLGFQLLGLSSEQAHLIDYAAETLARERARETRLKKLRTGSVVDMILSPEYRRYLKGE